MKKSSAKKPAGMKKAAIAVALKLSRTTVQKYLAQEDAPTHDGKGRYDLKAVQAYIAEQSSANVEGSEMRTLRALKLRLETEEMEDARLVRRGELVRKTQIAPAIAAFNADLTANLRQKFELELPGKYKGRGMVECQQMNAAAIDFVLGKLKEGQWALGIPGAAPASPGPGERAKAGPGGGGA